MKILLAEDEIPLVKRLLRILRDEAFAVDAVHDGEDALHMAMTGDYDVAVVDLGLPSLDGLALIRRLRQAGREFPILILTARDAWLDKAAGFKAGADDYLTKPFLPQELVVRLRALGRRARGLKADVIECGPLTYDPISGAFCLDEVPIRLTAFETRILQKLFQYKEVVVPREKLFEAVYEYKPEHDVPVASFEVIMGRLRRKIGPAMIETLRGYGYRLTSGQS